MANINNSLTSPARGPLAVRVAAHSAAAPNGIDVEQGNGRGQTTIDQEDLKKEPQGRLQYFRSGAWFRSAITLAILYLLALTFLISLYRRLPPMDDLVARAAAAGDAQAATTLRLAIPHSIEELRAVRSTLETYRQEYSSQVASLLITAYLFLQTFMIPGPLGINILAGSLYPFWTAMLFTAVVSTLGASLNYWLVRFQAGAALSSINHVSDLYSLRNVAFLMAVGVLALIPVALKRRVKKGAKGLPRRQTLLNLLPIINQDKINGSIGVQLNGSESTAGATAANGAPRNAFLDRVFAQNMYTGMNEYEEAIAPVKTNLFSRLKPASPSTSSLDVVEIGIGTGPSLKYYPREEYPNLSITAVDPNNFMLPYLYKNMDAQRWERDSISWQLGTAEALPLEDSSTDVVVCTLVLCSVSDVEKAVKEATRVLRPGGQFLFIEHTIAQPNASLLFKISQRALNPMQRALADGCNLTRDPLAVIEKAGFSSVDAMRFEVEGMGLIAPHVAGIAIA
ncbi:hypothetical protein KSW81_000892 [Nannochloris sp. 'desiccata']|nr:hypothetical protein KSW81_000892 [Chlorella desiccata (nom. nud.)]